MLCLWTTWTPSQKMLFWKRQQNTFKREGVPQEAVSPSAVGNVVVATVTSNTAITQGLLDQKDVDMSVDSKSSISLIQEGVSHRSHPTSVVSGLKDGRPTGTLGPGCAGI